MSTAMFEIKSVPTFRDMHQRFARADRVLLEARRDEMRAEAIRLVALEREEAPKRTGKFARDIRYRTFNEGDALGFRTYTPQPLGSYIVLGTKAHTITPRRAKALRFVVDGRVVFTQRVRHPGTKPNKFIGRAYRRWLPGARAMLLRISTRYVRAIKGSDR
jgi:hypothetical protein